MDRSAKLQVLSTADSSFATNSYLVLDEATRDAAVIDSNLEPELMVELARNNGANVRGILLTHTDGDHIAGLPRYRAAFGKVPIAVHGTELAMLTEGVPLRRHWDVGLGTLEEIRELIPGTPYTVGSLAFDVLHTPGHSPGGVTLRIGNALFTGDALFAGSIGRSDFSNSDAEALLAGIKRELLSQPDDFLVFSGHGPVTTIGQERRYNPFL
ncbi:MAG: MBL fold metallo-hydrolase [Candidatus Dormibacteraeota bacterium]|uniref:MBL fold metallo-hydrolase n=1 Tax=Candidatus Dormiibacter inghamiae TaxID=3127013 RepID=A0A934NCI9_9BACT|nr:MBL fold metallo-hydrolase [Candidatus Dormibacteraeota bacterium]MBJ7607502.1 MBL fold metallo-hydrolase [Candidatus Dormibacteraeota bacterium]